MPFELRITDAGRAALADGANRGTNAIRLTKMAIGDGSGPGGAADDGRTALRNQRAVAALGGTTMVSGRIAVRGEFNPTEAYGVSELGLLGRVGNGAEELYAYWTDGGELLASTVGGTRLVIAGSLDIAAAAAEVTVTIDASISLGDPALSGTVTAVGARVDALEGADTAAAAARTALGNRITSIEGSDFGALITALAARMAAIEAEDFASQITVLEGRSVIQSIQRGTITWDSDDVLTGGGEAYVEATIASVDPSKTTINMPASFFGYRRGSSSLSDPTVRIVRLSLASATRLRLSGAVNDLGLTSSNSISYEVVEFA